MDREELKTKEDYRDYKTRLHQNMLAKQNNSITNLEWATDAENREKAMILRDMR